MSKIFMLFFMLISGGALALQTNSALAGSFDVIVNSGVTMTAITKEEVKQIMLTNKTTWKDGSKIAIVSLSPDATNADDVTKEYMGMTSVQAKKHWLTKVFNGVLSAQPPMVDTPEEVVEKVASTPGAIGIVPRGTKPGKAKVLAEGK